MMKFPDKRTFYLFFERISLGRPQRLALLFLCSLILLVETVRVVRVYVFPEKPEYNYDELNALVDLRTSKVQQTYDSLLATRYFPSEEAIKNKAKAKKKSGEKRKAKKAKTTPELLPESININLAESTELERLPRIGPKTARAIIDKRIELGGFSTIEDLLKVKGIGPKTLELIKPFLTLDE